ncbi:transmembrane protein 179B isoform X1 [Phycodurus eques]|uniref:transmembrane protein 179B isoform X1 n=1 Tax=Phycodurus eques TaxID=693459 RepID=UPI002ACDD737|nr:transmembrane protein 179B isoform X1 [Phycodurus eques]
MAFISKRVTGCFLYPSRCRSSRGGEFGRRMMMRMRIMALTWLLVLELVLYASCFVCGIVTAASLTIVQGNFDGRCPLYGVVSYNSTANVLGVQASSSASLCYFVSAVSVTVAVVCFSLSLYWLHAICIDGVVRRERVWMNGAVIVCGVVLFFLLISGCMLKIGRDALCDSVTRGVPNVTRCSACSHFLLRDLTNNDMFPSDAHEAARRPRRRSGSVRSRARISTAAYEKQRRPRGSTSSSGSSSSCCSSFRGARPLGQRRSRDARTGRPARRSPFSTVPRGLNDVALSLCTHSLFLFVCFLYRLCFYSRNPTLIGFVFVFSIYIVFNESGKCYFKQSQDNVQSTAFCLSILLFHFINIPLTGHSSSLVGPHHVNKCCLK